MLQLLFNFQVRMCNDFLLFQKYIAAGLLEGWRLATTTPGMVKLAGRVMIELKEVRNHEARFVHGQVSIDIVTYGIST